MSTWDRDLPHHLNQLLRAGNDTSDLEQDPIRFPHRWPQGPDREVVAVISALLSYGRVASIGNAITSVLLRMGPTPSQAALRDSESAAVARFDGFVHRVTRGIDVARVWLGLGSILRRYGTIGSAMAEWTADDAPDLKHTLLSFRRHITEATETFEPRQSFEHFLPDPNRGSACKRYMMLLRWMVRGPDTVDFGDWAALGTERLTIPLDTHVHRIGRYLGLTKRRSPDWKTAQEITGVLRTFDAKDPLRYDFALAHLGISGRCPTYRVPDICSSCRLNAVCQLPNAPEDKA